MVHLRSSKCYTRAQRTVNHCLSRANIYNIIAVYFLNVAAYIAEQMESQHIRNRF